MLTRPQKLAIVRPASDKPHDNADEGERVMYDRYRRLAAGLAVLALNSPDAHGQATTDASQGTSSGGLEEIVVTAERRSDNLQTTPVAASVLSGSDLAEKGVTTVDQLQFVAPNVTIQNFGQGNTFNIRGIGETVASSSTTVGVISYRDGVATFPGYLQSEPYYDIASVEVLRSAGNLRRAERDRRCRFHH